MPRGWRPTSIRVSSVLSVVSMTDTSNPHQFDTSNRRPSGVTARNFGTAPVGMTRSMRCFFTSMR